MDMNKVTWQRAIKVADGISTGSQLKSRCRNYPGLPEWVQCNRKGPFWWKREAEKRPSERCNERKTGLAIAGFKDGRAPPAKECGQPLDAGKGKEMDSPFDPPERNSTLMTP